VGPLPFRRPAGGRSRDLFILPANNPNLFIIKPFICLPFFRPPPSSSFARWFCNSLFRVKAVLWSGSKGVARKKHRPSYFGFRIADFGFFWFSFSIRIPQSAFRNLEAGPSGVTEFGIRNVEFGIFTSFFPFRI
jgi:hypothetical protein